MKGTEGMYEYLTEKCDKGHRKAVSMYGICCKCVDEGADDFGNRPIDRNKWRLEVCHYCLGYLRFNILCNDNPPYCMGCYTISKRDKMISNGEKELFNNSHSKTCEVCDTKSCHKTNKHCIACELAGPPTINIKPAKRY